MELLIIPLVLVVGGFLLNRAQRQTESEIASQRAETERDIAADRQRQAALDAYFDRMTDLLLKEGLRESRKGAEVRNIARTRTLTVLRSLDRMRKGQLLRFLCESRLIIGDDPIIDLNGADLVEAHLYTTVGTHFREIGPDGSGLTGWGLNLSKANLSGAYLNKAELYGADLSTANLSNAQLADAQLVQADLTGADLSKALLSRAFLLRADLTGADLSKALLLGANLTGAIVDLEQIEPSQLSDDTIMPDGTTRKEWVKRKAKEAA